jgi:hypothetical protein
LRFVGEGGDEVADPPGPGALVVHPACVQAEDAAGVAHGEGADVVADGPGDDGPGGFVLGLADAPPVPGLHDPLAAAVASPAP